MFARLAALLEKFFGQGIARFLTGAGMATVSYAAVKVTVLAGLASVVANAQSMTPAVLNVMLMAGFGDGLSIIGAAMVTRAALNSGKLGLTKLGAN